MFTQLTRTRYLLPLRPVRATPCRHPLASLVPTKLNRVCAPFKNGKQIDNHVAGHSLPVIFCFREKGRLVRGSDAGGSGEHGGEDGEAKKDSRFTMSLVSCGLLCPEWSC